VVVCIRIPLPTSTTASASVCGEGNERLRANVPKLPPKPKPEPRVFETSRPNPDGTVVLSYSELDTYRQCPLKHFLGYRERWSRPVSDESPLSRGILWHVVMEEHYGVIKDYSEAHGGRAIKEEEYQDVLISCWEAVFPHLHDPVTGNQSADQELIQWMYEGYVEKYGVDPDWEILAIEYPFEVALDMPDGNPSPYYLKGKIDLIVRNRVNNSVWIIDHKSGKDLPTQMALEIDDQFGLYGWATRKLGYRIMGLMHNAARTQRNQGDMPGADLSKKTLKKQTLEERMHRTLLNRSDHELRNLADDAYAVAVNIYPELVGRERLPLYSSPDARSCGWKCDFKEAHLIARTGREIHDVLIEAQFEQNFTRH